VVCSQLDGITHACVPAKNMSSCTKYSQVCRSSCAVCAGFLSLLWGNSTQMSQTSAHTHTHTHTHTHSLSHTHTLKSHWLAGSSCHTHTHTQSDTHTHTRTEDSLAGTTLVSTTTTQQHQQHTDTY